MEKKGVVLEPLICPMDLQFSVYNAQKTWCDHPHCTQKEAWVQECQWPPRVINPVSSRGSMGSLECTTSSEMLGRGPVPVWRLMWLGAWVRMGHGMVRKGTSPGSAVIPDIVKV